MLLSRALLLISLLSALTASADERVPVASVTLTGGFAVRSARFLAAGAPETSLGGVSPTVLRLRGELFPLAWLGAELEAGTDAFLNTSDDRTLSTWAARLETRAGVALRWASSSGFVVSGALGYGLSGAPVIRVAENTATGALLLSHGPTARVGLGFTRGAFDANVGFAALLAVVGGRVSVFEPRAFVGWRFFEGATVALTAGLDYSSLFEPDTGRYAGAAHRFSLGLKVTVLPERAAVVAPTLRETSLELVVQRPDGAAATGALVTLDAEAPRAVDASGALRLARAPGRVHARVTLDGFRASERDLDVREGEATRVALTLEPRTGPGRLSGVVRAAATKAAVPEAQLTVGDKAVRADAAGAWVVDACGPGPVKVRVEAQGFTPAEEVVQVPPEGEATLDVALEQLGKGSPATLRGLVRSLTGEPLKASVVIRGSATKVVVSPEGRFVVTVPGGTWFLVISAPGYVTQTKKVVLADGDQAIFHAELQKVK